MAAKHYDGFKRHGYQLLAALEASVAPALLKQKLLGDRVRVWLPDCGTGELAYASAAILRAQADRSELPPTIQIFATDTDADALAIARRGRCGAEIAGLIPPSALTRFFQPDPPLYQARPIVRELITFAQHDLAQDPPFAHLDLIICQHLLATLPSETLEELAATFHWCLQVQGLLLIELVAPNQTLSQLFARNSGANVLFERRDLPTANRPIAHIVTTSGKPPELSPAPRMNEHLLTMNQVLRGKIGELGRANNDLNNLIGATELAIIFLDQHLQIARFTPQAAALFNLIPADQGRPLADIQPTLDYPQLLDDAAGTLAHLQVIEREVQRADGGWCLMRLRPYRTDDDRIAGVVLVCIDITARRQAEAELRRARDELEQRVVERTEALSTANVQLQAEIAERARLEEERAELLRQLVTTQEDERRHIARELHDELGQTLTALGLGLGALPSQLPDRDGFLETVAQLQQLARQLDQELNQLAVNLRPAALYDLGLLPALQNHVERWAERSGVHAELEVLGLKEVRLPLDIENAIYRVIQEALTNILKHAAAQHVSIILDQRAGQLRLIVEDDGRGFDTSQLQDATNGRRHLGLLGMRERVALVGGTLTFQSEPDAGTTLFVLITIPESPGDAGHGLVHSKSA
jgi:PAS domain S-box-containing protein